MESFGTQKLSFIPELSFSNTQYMRKKMSELKNVSQKKRVIVMILCITTLASLYFTKVYFNVKSTRLILTNECQTLSE